MNEFEITRLPCTQNQTHIFTRNVLLAKYTVIFHFFFKIGESGFYTAFIGLMSGGLAPFNGHDFVRMVCIVSRQAQTAHQLHSPSFVSDLSARRVHRELKSDIWIPLIFLLLL